jgi:hypothetical protein
MSTHKFWLPFLRFFYGRRATAVVIAIAYYMCSYYILHREPLVYQETNLDGKTAAPKVKKRVWSNGGIGAKVVGAVVLRRVLARVSLLLLLLLLLSLGLPLLQIDDE